MEIFLSSKADRQLSKIPPKMHDFLISKVRELAEEPFGKNSKKLRDREGWRYRVGDYRILYTKQGKNLIVLSVAHRREVYKFK